MKENNNKIICSMCVIKIDIKNTFIPRECLNNYGVRAHRICSDCWWEPVSGFAREDASHCCPGCAKNMPLTNLPILNVKYKEPEIIDLTL